VNGDGRRRVVVTGIGIVSPLGVGRDAAWEAAVAGTACGGPVTHFDTDGFDCRIACEARDFHPADFLDHRTARRADRITQFAVAAAALAREDAGLDIDGDGRRVGCVIGTGTGGGGVREENHRVMAERGPTRVSPFTIPHSMLNMPSAMIAMQQGIRGPVFATVTACAAGTDAIGVGASIVRRGDADVVFAGGSDAMITPFWLAAFDAMRVLSHRNDDPGHAPRPFAAGRDGFLIGEGAAVLVLEDAERARARGAEVVCEVAGYGASADAHHITDPDPSGESQARAMSHAVRDAGLDPSEIGYVNAHGGASQPGDPSEVRAIRLALGDEVAARTPVSGTKSMHGHCMGATGAIEAALTAMAIVHGVIPPTINLDAVDPDCVGVDHVANAARRADVTAALSSNNGLGGHNAAVVLRRWEDR
jgi:3-oxoacyl-[acyl-carrier-protein] synthase II